MRTIKYFFGPLFLMVLLFISCEKDSELMDITRYADHTPQEVYDDNNVVLATSPENDLCLTSSLENYTTFNLLTVGKRKRLFYVSYDDPVKDNTGSIDIEKMYFVYHPYTGDYDVIIKTMSTDPFYKDFSVSINLHNPDRLFFKDAMNYYDLVGKSSVVNLSGNYPALMDWAVGDKVAANSLAGLGNPPGYRFFRSTVSNFPPGFLTNEDAIAYGIGEGIATIKPITDEVLCDILIMETQALREVFSRYPFTSEMSRCLFGAVKFLHTGKLEMACQKFSEFENEAMLLSEKGLISVEQKEMLLSFSSKIKGDCS